jgi:hypothetical protein
MTLRAPCDDEGGGGSGTFELAGPLTRPLATILEASASPGINRGSRTSGASRGRLRAVSNRRRSRDRRRGCSRRSELRRRWRTVRRKLCPGRRVRPRNHDGPRRNAFSHPCSNIGSPGAVQLRRARWLGLCQLGDEPRPWGATAELNESGRALVQKFVVVRAGSMRGGSDGCAPAITDVTCIQSESASKPSARHVLDSSVEPMLSSQRREREQPPH